MTDEEIHIRDGGGDDVPFLVSSWRSLKHAFVFDHAPKDHCEAECNLVLRGVLADPDVRMRVAHPASDPDTILGIAVHKGPTLYFVFVSQPIRRTGVGRSLCEDIAPTSYAFKTHGFWRRMKPEQRGWVYLPRIAWRLP